MFSYTVLGFFLGFGIFRVYVYINNKNNKWTNFVQYFKNDENGHEQDMEVKRQRNAQIWTCVHELIPLGKRYVLTCANTSGAHACKCAHVLIQNTSTLPPLTRLNMVKAAKCI